MQWNITTVCDPHLCMEGATVCIGASIYNGECTYIHYIKSVTTLSRRLLRLMNYLLSPVRRAIYQSARRPHEKFPTCSSATQIGPTVETTTNHTTQQNLALSISRTRNHTLVRLMICCTQIVSFG